MTFRDVAGVPSDNAAGPHGHAGGDISGQMPFVRIVGGVNVPGLDTRLTTAEADIVALPQGVLGYAEVTANQLNVTTETDLTGLSVTVTAGTGRRLRIRFQGELRVAVAGDVAIVNIKESTTTLGRIRYGPNAISHETVGGEVFVTPSSGSHTYKATLQLASGTGDVDLIAASGSAAYIVVEDVGAV